MSSLTVIVPVYNAEATLEPCLAAIRSSYGVHFDLLVIDDSSTDRSKDIAYRYADNVICFDKNVGSKTGRNMALDLVKSEILVYIDSDVGIRSDTLLKIEAFFKENPDTVAVTGILSHEDLGFGYFSDYKNLYMNYTFNQMPSRVSFLYGSIFALRASIKPLCVFDLFPEDTSLGHRLADQGYDIRLLKDLEVTHMKKYGLRSFISNDFMVPFHWSKIFWTTRAWGRVFKRGPVFAHTSKAQAFSLLLTALTVISIMTPISVYAFLLWLSLNIRFFIFLSRKRSFFFAMIGLWLTFIDHLVMFSGVIAGTMAWLIERTFQKEAHG